MVTTRPVTKIVLPLDEAIDLFEHRRFERRIIIPNISISNSVAVNNAYALEVRQHNGKAALDLPHKGIVLAPTHQYTNEQLTALIESYRGTTAQFDLDVVRAKSNLPLFYVYGVREPKRTIH